MIGTHHTKESTLPMSKEEAIQIVLEELHHRLPKDNKEGFLPSDKVFQAMALLSEEEE